MAIPDPATRAEIRERLAKAINAPSRPICYVQHHPIDGDGIGDDWCYKCECSTSKAAQSPPDPFTNAADSLALRAWLLEEAQWKEWRAFFAELKRLLKVEDTYIDGYSGPVYSGSDIKLLFSASLEEIALAAGAAVKDRVESLPILLLHGPLDGEMRNASGASLYYALDAAIAAALMLADRADENAYVLPAHGGYRVALAAQVGEDGPKMVGYASPAWTGAFPKPAEFVPVTALVADCGNRLTGAEGRQWAAMQTAA